MTASPPLTVYCTVNRDEDDDQSEVTWLHGDQGDLAETNDSGKLAADPYFLYALDDRRSPKTGGQELFDLLKLQIARQQEKIDALSLKLERCENENEELRAVNAQLVEDLALVNMGQSDIKVEKCPSKVHKAPSRQPLLEESTRLAKDNARLEAVVRVMRASFHAYIRDSRREHRERKEDAKIIRQENQTLRRELSRLPRKMCSAGEEGIARTASTGTLELSETIESSHVSGPSLSRSSSADRVDEEEGEPSGNVLNNIRIYKDVSRMCKKITMAYEEDAPSNIASSADELIVGFGERRGATLAGQEMEGDTVSC